MPVTQIPAAQYLRMSTEHQQYSLENQSAAIRTYADTHNFEIVQTYCDAAKSGVVLKYRTGLGQLLQDVTSGKARYKAILVYDISRWGRFQDSDESAHYEFLCKLAGIPVHYCAELFVNDGTLSSLILKAVKRTMAGEYSRELGVKVLAGQKRLAAMGFKQGGLPGYGFQRLLISGDGQPKQKLVFRERKSLVTDRVILVPGDAQEVQTVREIYRMLISDGLSMPAIARALNQRGCKYQGDSRWSHYAVAEILMNPKYAGFQVYGRVSTRLHTPPVKVPMSQWIVTATAHEPIVDHVTFLNAQQVLSYRTGHRSDEDLLNSLRALLAREGRLSYDLIARSRDVPCPSTYKLRFGSIRGAYRRIGYWCPQNDSINVRCRTQALRDELMERIAAMFPEDVSVVRPGGRRRCHLELRSGTVVSVLVARSVRVWTDTIHWQIEPREHECRFVTLLAGLDDANRSFDAFYLFASIDRRKRFRIRRNDNWLLRGLYLENLSGLINAIASITSRLTGVS